MQLTDRLPRGSIPAALIVLLAALIVVPLRLNDYYLTVLTSVCLYAMLGLGLNIVVGFAGLLDLGYAAFFAIGAYTTAYLSTNPMIALGPWTITFPVPSFWLLLPVSALVAATFGALIGIPTLRLRSDYLAIVTLGFGEITRISVTNWDWTGGPNGLYAVPQPAFRGFTFTLPMHFYYLSLGLMLVTLFCVARLAGSRIGRAWAYIREDELAAAAMGINTIRLKLLAYALGAVWGGVAGAFLSVQLSAVSPDSFKFDASVTILIIVVLGGLGSIPGVILGAIVVEVTPELLRNLPGDLINWRLLVFSLALVALMIVRPQGLWPSRQRTRELHMMDDDIPDMSLSMPGVEAPLDR